MVEENRVYPDAPWERGYEAIRLASLKHGDKIAREWLLRHMMLVDPEKCATGAEAKRNQLAILVAIERIKEELLEGHNMALRSVRGEGWEIVPVSEQTAWAMDEVRKDVRRALGCAAKRLSFVDFASLSDEQRKENADALAKLAALRPTMRKQLW